MKRLVLSVFFICFQLVSAAQNDFMTGSSRESIEPGNAIVSAALAGYGVPREGRFSLTWKEIDQEYRLKAIAAYKDKIFAVTGDNELLSGTVQDEEISWELTGEVPAISGLTVMDNVLYVINSQGRLLHGEPGKDKISLKRLRQSDRLSAVVSYDKTLYAVNREGILLAGKPGRNSIEWNRRGPAKDIISLTADDRMLYALNKGDTIFSVKPYMHEKAWTVIGRNNGFTFTEHLKSIAVVNGVIFGLNRDGRLLRGSHNTNKDLAVNTLAIKNDNKTVVISGVDVCGFDASFVNEIKEHIYKTRDIPPAAILINASHTHFAPVTQSWAAWGEFYHVPDTNYLNNVVKKGIIKSIEGALDNMAPASLYFGRGATSIGINRRNTAAVKRPYDNTLDVIKIVNSNDRIASVLFSAGCHPVFRNEGAESFTIGANYPAVARKQVNAMVETSHSLFLQGCAGDINPRESDYRRTGTELGSDVASVLNAAMQPLKSEISFELDTVKIPVDPWPVEKIKAFRAQNITKKGDVEAEKNVRWADLMLERYENNTLSNVLPVYVQTINIGRWKLVGLSREAVTEYGPAIRKLFPDKLVTVAGYCNDVSSYLPAKWHIETGVYEGFGSFFWYGQPGIPPKDVLTRIVDHIKR